MNKIDKLIKEMCPNGVEYKKISDLCKITRGRVMDKMYLLEHAGDYPVYSSQTLNDGVFGKIDSYDFDGEYIQWTTDGAKAGSIFYRNGKFSVTNVCGLLKLKEEYENNIMTSFLAYIIDSVSKRYVNYSTSNPKLMSNVVAEIKIPIPPIKIQKEIVKVLDKFVELEAELEVELEARKKQYDFYRGNLFCNLNVDIFKITDIFELKNGFTPSKANSFFWTNGNIPWFRMEDIREHGRILNDSIHHITSSAIKGNLFPANSIIVSTSATIGEHALITVPFLSNQRFTCLILKNNYRDKIDIKYIYYYCFILDEYCKSNINPGSFNSVDMNSFRNFEFKIPSIEEQERIVNILDKFDKLVNDISDGLPAEIQMRRKQYEYYRNKLLTFEEL